MFKVPFVATHAQYIGLIQIKVLTTLPYLPFSQASVILFTGWGVCIPACTGSRHPPGQTQTPPGRHPLGRHPQTPPRQTPTDTPQADTPPILWQLADTPLRRADTPPPATTAADGTHATGMHFFSFFNCYKMAMFEVFWMALFLIG